MIEFAETTIAERIVRRCGVYKKAGQITASVVVVAVVGVAAFFIASRFAGGDASGQATQGDNTFFQELRDRLEPTIQADQALPPARGQYGDKERGYPHRSEENARTPVTEKFRILFSA